VRLGCLLLSEGTSVSCTRDWDRQPASKGVRVFRLRTLAGELQAISDGDSNGVGGITGRAHVIVDDKDPLREEGRI